MVSSLGPSPPSRLLFPWFLLRFLAFGFVLFSRILFFCALGLVLLCLAFLALPHLFPRSCHLYLLSGTSSSSAEPSVDSGMSIDQLVANTLEEIFLPVPPKIPFICSPWAPVKAAPKSREEIIKLMGLPLPPKSSPPESNYVLIRPPGVLDPL